MIASRFPMEVRFPGLGLDFEINNVAFSIFGFDIYWYALIIVTGLVLAVLYAMRRSERFGLDRDDMLDVIIVGFICSIIGARLYYIIFYDHKFDSFWDAVNLRDGGIAIYGAVIGAFLGGGLMCRKKKMSAPAMFDAAGLGFLIGQGIGRWGNFANQEAFGTPTDLPWGMQSANTGNVPVHPCFLYESLWCLIGFAVLHFLSKKWYKFRGQYFLLYLLWYGLGRAWIEGLRTDSLWLVPGVIRVSQLLAVLCVVVTIPLLVLGLKGRIPAFKPVEEAEAEALEQAGAPEAAEETGAQESETAEETGSPEAAGSADHGGE